MTTLVASSADVKEQLERERLRQLRKAERAWWIVLLSIALAAAGLIIILALAGRL